MRVVVNMENARSFEPAEPGPYPLVIKAMGNPEKKEKSTIIEVEFQFEDPEMDRACGTITRMYPIDGKGAGFFRDFWKAATGQELPVGQAGIAIDTDELDNLVEKLKAQDIHILEQTTISGGRRVCFFEGPDGVQLEFIEMKS